MSHGPAADEPVPVASLPPHRQVRLLALVAGGALVLVLLVWGIGRLLHVEPAAPPPEPPGTFRPTPGQMRALTIERIGASALGDLTTATGMIAADGDLSTPVLLPYTGQVVKVLVDAGQVVGKGQPLLLVRTSDFVDARNTLFAANATLRSTQAALPSRDTT